MYVEKCNNLSAIVFGYNERSINIQNFFQQHILLKNMLILLLYMHVAVELYLLPVVYTIIKFSYFLFNSHQQKPAPHRSIRGTATATTRVVTSQRC